MCGFVGFSDKKENGYDKNEIIKLMSERIAHRGPDDYKTFLCGSTAIAFRRLSIIDIKSGAQPMISSCGRYVIVMNGEVYNYLELRSMLEKNHGCRFATNSDTEAVLQTYIHYGTKTPEMLRGMFSFVIYDKTEDSFFGARDYFGIKPFYYTIMNETFMFASEIKAFLDHPDFIKEINTEAFKMYMVFQYSPLTETIFKGVYRLEPGTYFTYKNGKISTVKYFDPLFTPSSGRCTPEVIDETIRESVKCHKIADVDIGGFLSGGIDSCYITSYAKPDKTYTVGFDEKGFDEIPLAEKFSKHCSIVNVSKQISSDDFFSALPNVQYHSDEPTANLSTVPLYFLSRLASREYKSVLSGEGADELFAGYVCYRRGRAGDIYCNLPLKFRKLLCRCFKWFPSRVGKFIYENSLEDRDTYIGQAFIMNDEEANSLLNDKYKSDISYKDVTRPFFDKAKKLDDVSAKQYVDMNLWLPNDILMKADKMTMAHSLELRVPYLDREVWEKARLLTRKEKFRGIKNKIALRKAASFHIPEEFYQREKVGFVVPFRIWLNEDKYYNTIKKEFSEEYVSDIFDKAKILNMLEEHREGVRDRARAIYTVYSFLLWYKVFFIQEGKINE